MKRQCGSCSLCCKLVPVEELGKRAGVRCKYQRHNAKGCCTLHSTPQLPVSCRFWDCHWLKGAELPRPDHSHYVIDMMPDKVTVTDNNTGIVTDQPVVQVWLDPDYPDAHKDPALRRYINKWGEKGVAAIIRLDYSRSFCLFSPSLTGRDYWIETKPQEATSTTPHKERLRQMLEQRERENSRP